MLHVRYALSKHSISRLNYVGFLYHLILLSQPLVLFVHEGYVPGQVSHVYDGWQTLLVLFPRDDKILIGFSTLFLTDTFSN
jgi:hypothetical protein